MAQPNQFTNSKRFGSSTITELQDANRSPIFGYQDIPTMSIEDAVESIIPFVPHVQSYAKEAKKHCRRNTHLSINESAAIYLYTMMNDFYRCFNQALRVENRSTLKPWFAFLKLFIAALKKLPSSPGKVWRGVGNNFGSSFSENDIHTWWSVNSCALDHNIARFFADPKGTLFSIESIYGKNITKYSKNQNEKEIILMPGTRLRVKSAWSVSDGLSTVELEEW
jgi:NAD:arginine ADP-ribosyltransferase